MLEIADWLEKLGMPEYAQRFAENGITAAALRHLTDQDLKDIGVLLGHRRIMLATIAKLDGPPEATATRVTAPNAQDTTERAATIPARRNAYIRIRCRRSHGRAAAHHSDVLRSGRLHRHRGAARRGGMARSRRLLSRYGVQAKETKSVHRLK